MPHCSGRYGWDKLWADFALEMWDWVSLLLPLPPPPRPPPLSLTISVQIQNDTMLAGFAVFHWQTYEVVCGCGGCYNPPTELGLTSLPKTLGVWLEIGQKMLGQ